jgi:hypothetical protein
MVKIELDRASQARMRRTIERYAELTKQGFEEGVREIGKSSARRLANTVQPFGLSPAKGASLEKSIGRQVDAVYLGVNLGAFPATSSISKAHLAARKNGKVPYRQFRKERGKPWLDLITMGQKEEYKRKVVKKAGRAKAAWVTAGNKLKMGNLSGIPKWISRHVGNSWGDVSFIGSGVRFTIALINKTPYIRAIQPDSAIKKALKQGMINGYKRMETIIKKKTKQLNQ